MVSWSDVDDALVNIFAVAGIACGLANSIMMYIIWAYSVPRGYKVSLYFNAFGEGAIEGVLFGCSIVLGLVAVYWFAGPRSFLKRRFT